MTGLPWRLEYLLLPGHQILVEWQNTVVVQCDYCSRCREILRYPRRPRQFCSCGELIAESVPVLVHHPVRGVA